MPPFSMPIKLLSLRGTPSVKGLDRLLSCEVRGKTKKIFSWGIGSKPPANSAQNAHPANCGQTKTSRLRNPRNGFELGGNCRRKTGRQRQRLARQRGRNAVAQVR